MALTLHATFATQDEFRTAYELQIARGGLLVAGASVPSTQAGAEVLLTVTVEGRSVNVPARIASVIPGVGVAVLFNGVPLELATFNAPVLEAELEEVEAEDTHRQPVALSERMRQMTVTEKMQLALSGQRDERAAILRDTNKTLHLFVLKNPRIALDEVQAAAKLAQISPDALKFIADHKEWGANPTVAAALVRNPKIPVPMALRLMEKLPMTEIRTIAKGGLRDAIVHAARRKVNG